MVAEIRVYFEGHPSLREGFHAFFSSIYAEAKARRCRIELIAGRGKSSTIEDFKYALGTHPDAWNLLLVDSDGPYRPALSAELCERSGLSRSLEDRVFWMAQVMESWFLADVEALKRFYGPGIRETVLQGNPKVEKIPKADVIKRLEQATAKTSKGKYHKTQHAPELLKIINPERVRNVAPNCERMFHDVLQQLQRRRQGKPGATRARKKTARKLPKQ